MKDFFVSYTQSDKSWAEWIANTLEEASYTTIIQAWDFLPGSNFGVEMHRATMECHRTIAVLSKSYLASLFTLSEWVAAFSNDPSGIQRKLVPVRVEPCEVTGLLKSLVYCDLVGLDEASAKERLIGSLRSDRIRPSQPITFPGQHSAVYPGPVAPPSREDESEEVRAIKKLLNILRTSFVTFVAQCRVRNELVQAMRQRLGIKDPLEYERFFSRYYSLMDDEERHLHSTIRAYTENVLSDYNTRALQILDQHSELVEQVELLPELQRHLTLWLGKYKNIMRASPSVCLVYVGVEEGVPFPEGVELKLQAHLNVLKQKRK